MNRAAAMPALAALLALPLAARAAECGSHVVQPGETLSAIARKFDGLDAQAIFEANRDRLTGPDMIRVGQSLRIPCAPGATPADAPAKPESGTAQGAAQSAAQSAGAKAGDPNADDPNADDARPGDAEAEGASGDGGAAASAGDAPAGDGQGAAQRPLLPSPPPFPAPVDQGPIHVAWGGDVEALAAGPRAMARLRAALALSAPGRTLDVAAAPGPAQALARIAPGGGAALALAFLAPDCGALPRLDPAAAAICARYDLSAPLADAEIAWIVPAGAAVAGPADLAGARICRPAGRPDSDIAALGLAPPRARRLAPITAEDCLAALRAGEADAASLFVEGATALGPDLVRVPGMGGRLPAVALAPRGDAAAQVALRALDAGLARLAEEELAASSD